MNKKLIPLLILPTILLSACNLLSPFDNYEDDFVPSQSSNPSSSDGSSSSSESKTEISFNITLANFIDNQGHLKVQYTCNQGSPFSIQGHAFSKLNITGISASEIDHSNSGYFTLLSPVVQKTLKFEFYDTNNIVYITYRTSDVYLYGEELPPEPPADIDYPTGYNTLYWFDEFDGDSLNLSKWSRENGNGTDGWGNNEAQYYTSNNDFVSDGMLTIQARKESRSGFNYTSTRMKTQNKVKFTYGYVEARISLPAVTGMWPAFWMMPNNSVYGGWPHSGEIDIMEARGRLSNQSSSAIHFSYKNGGWTYLDHVQSGHAITGFHKYAVEWQPDFIKFYIDDFCHAYYDKGEWSTSGAKDSETAPFDQDFYIILNLAVGGNFDGGVLPPGDFSSADMKIDYVRVFKK